MIEPIMFIAIGFLLAGLLVIGIGPCAGGAPHHATPGSLDPPFDGGDPG